MDQIKHLLVDQAGVIARTQLLDAGCQPHDVARWVRRKELTPILRGVYVDHTGLPTWQQRAWAGVLYARPAALTHSSALRAADGPGRRDADTSSVEVLIANGRHLAGQPGLRIIRARDFDERVLWTTGPPRVRYEDAVLDVAAEAPDRLAAIAALAGACGGRRTTASRLLVRAESRSRMSDRHWLTRVLADIAGGTCSVLEHGYLSLVERAHGLPTGSRQVSHRHGQLSSYSDVELAEYGLIVELDGRLWHGDAAARAADLDRDLTASAIHGHETLRIGYRQVFDRPCRTAVQVGAILNRRGWRGRTGPCPKCEEQQAA